MRIHLLLILLLIPAAYALQVTPASTSISQAQAFTITIINDAQTTASITMNAQGSFADELQIQPESFTLEAQQRQEVRISFTGEPLLAPGTHTTQIVAEQQAVRSESTISSTAAVAHQIRYLQPRQGVYFETSLQTTQMSIGDPAVITISATNIGTQRSQARASIRILENGDILYEDSQTLDVESAQTRSFSTRWTPEQQGAYTIQTALAYGENTIRKEYPVTVGERTLDIGEITATRLGEQTRIDIPVTNTYNQPYPYVEATVRTVEGNARTPPASLQPGERAVLSAYLQETQVPYANITVNYPPSSIEVRADLSVPKQQQGPVLFYAAGILAVLLIIFIYLSVAHKRQRGKL